MKQKTQEGMCKDCVKEPPPQKKQNLTARVTDTRLRTACQGNIMTDVQGVTEDMGPQDMTWTLEAEISQKQPPQHYQLVTRLSPYELMFDTHDVLVCAPCLQRVSARSSTRLCRMA